MAVKQGYVLGRELHPNDANVVVEKYSDMAEGGEVVRQRLHAVAVVVL